MTQTDSTRLDWQHRTSDEWKRERFWFDEWTWDVYEAKVLLEAIPHDITEVDAIGQLARWEEVSVISSRQRTADYTFPVIVGWLHGEQLVIDGWHRINRAVEEGVQYIPAVVLTEKESANLREFS